MAERERRQKVGSDPPTDEAEAVSPASTERSDRLKNELDDLLDEIDEVLETNAEEFVKSYIQKGGE
ncbi:MAG TPA: ubiquitin-like protein Pup [Acidimicrobiaceae bacterium]|nr:ubiquitin-like protein Pup [Acidimicrobiaceae bacterium]